MTAIASPWQLRAFTPDDTAPLTEAFTDPEIARWSAGQLVDGDVVGWWTRRNDSSDPTHWSRAVAAADGTLVGSLSLLHLNDDQQAGEIGYMVLPQARRQGVARWAVATACAQAFGQLGVRRLSLFHAVSNLGSCAVATTSGFLLEGTLRESYRYGDGVWHDEHLHARLASD
jgi:RimJ/RimL family protein N-acetyltransferase